MTVQGLTDAGGSRQTKNVGTITQKIVDKMHNIMLNNPKVKIRELVQSSKISYGNVFYVIHDILGIKKIFEVVFMLAYYGPKTNS